MAKDQLELPKGWVDGAMCKVRDDICSAATKGDSSRVLAVRRIQTELKRHIEQIGNYYHGLAQGPLNR